MLDSLILMAAYQAVSQGIVQVPFKQAGCLQLVQYSIVITWLLVLTMEMELLMMVTSFGSKCFLCTATSCSKDLSFT